MYTLFKIELYKIFKRPRTYISFGAMAALIAIIQIGLKFDGKEYIEFVLAEFSKTFTIDGTICNGYFVCYAILNTLLIHVPLLIALIAADMISGEANMGTLRVLLSKPISRTQFILAKFFATTVYTVLLLVWIAILALFLSMLIFGTDDLFLLKNNYAVQLKENDIFWRYIGAFFFAALAMITVASIAFFLSQFAENSIGPIVATISIIMVLTILSTMSIPLFNKVKPYIFTTHMVAWKEFFDVQVNADNESIQGTIQYPQNIVRSCLVLLAHIVFFVSASIYFFKKKDVLS